MKPCPYCATDHDLCAPCPATASTGVGGATLTPRATCPACNLGGIPVTDGRLAAHGWARGGTLTDGPLDADGNPTPGEWVGGCTNRDPGRSAPGPAHGSAWCPACRRWAPTLDGAYRRHWPDDGAPACRLSGEPVAPGAAEPPSPDLGDVRSPRDAS